MRLWAIDCVSRTVVDEAAAPAARQQTLPLHALPGGAYVLRVSTPGGPRAVRVVVSP